jgi:hypothetical protein
VSRGAGAGRLVYLVGKTLAIGGHLPTCWRGWAFFPLGVTVLRHNDIIIVVIEPHLLKKVVVITARPWRLHHWSSISSSLCHSNEFFSLIDLR